MTAPADAPGRLRELSRDVDAAVLLDSEGNAAAGDGELAAAARELLEAARLAAGEEPPAEVEVQLPSGAVYAVRQGGWTLAAVTARGSLSSLMRWDMRVVLGELG